MNHAEEIIYLIMTSVWEVLFWLIVPVFPLWLFVLPLIIGWCHGR